METEKILMIVTPTLMWFGLFVSLKRAEGRLRAAEARMDERDRAA